MFLQIEKFLNPAELASVAQIARQSKFVDGKLSNPHNIVKQNVIADPGDAVAQRASQIALVALQRSEEARNFIFPRRVAAPTFARYAVGMKYGPHIDAAAVPSSCRLIPINDRIHRTIRVRRSNAKSNTRACAGASG